MEHFDRVGRVGELRIVGRGFLLGGAAVAGEAVQDFAGGPRVVACSLSDYEKRESSGRYRSFCPGTYEFTFADANGNTVRVTISEQDKDAVRAIIDARGAGTLTYYSQTSIFVSMQGR